METDNAAATRWVQICETLTSPECGSPSVIVAHHTKKKGENDDADSADLIRGASALVAGVRWAACLEQQKRTEDAADLLTLRLVKANGVPPRMGPLILCRDQEHEGALRVAIKDEISQGFASRCNDSIRGRRAVPTDPSGSNVFEEFCFPLATGFLDFTDSEGSRSAPTGLYCHGVPALHQWPAGALPRRGEHPHR